MSVVIIGSVYWRSAVGSSVCKLHVVDETLGRDYEEQGAFAPSPLER